MRFLIDTNILLHAANTASPAHKPARKFLEEHLNSRTPWCTTWPILYEFLRVATHRRVFPKPLKPKQALHFISTFVGLEEVSILSPTTRHFAVLDKVVSELGQPTGNFFHDVHTAALMLEHGIAEIATADTDFFRFRFLKVLNPLQP